MRVRILKSAAGVMDGVSLSHLLPGLTYDVAPSIAHYLTSNHFADQVSSAAAALVIPVDDPGAFDALAGGVSVAHPLNRPADKPRRARKKR